MEKRKRTTNRVYKKRYRKTIDKLAACYQDHTTKECAEILGIGVDEVRSLLVKHGIRLKSGERSNNTEKLPKMQKISISYRQWREQMIEDIRKNYADTPTAEIAARHGADYYTVAREAAKMGLKKSGRFMRGSWSRGHGRTIGKDVAREMDEYLKEHFHDTPNTCLAEKFGVDVKTIRRHARKLGLWKTEEFMTASRARKRMTGENVYADQYAEYRIRRIAEVYPGGTKEDIKKLGEELGISAASVRDIARNNNIRRLTAEERMKDFLEEFKAYFPEHSDKECAEHFSMKIYTLQSIARKHKIYKSREHIESVYDENVKRWGKERKCR